MAMANLGHSCFFFPLLFHSFWIMNNIEIGNFDRHEHDAGRCSHNHMIWHKVLNNSPFFFCCCFSLRVFVLNRFGGRKEKQKPEDVNSVRRVATWWDFIIINPKKEKARKIVNKSIWYVDFEPSRSLILLVRNVLPCVFAKLAMWLAKSFHPSIGDWTSLVGENGTDIHQAEMVGSVPNRIWAVVCLFVCVLLWITWPIPIRAFNLFAECVRSWSRNHLSSFFPAEFRLIISIGTVVAQRQ